MSIARQVYITCDECFTEYDAADWRAETVRQLARDDGWRTNLPGGRDLCPACRADHSIPLNAKHRRQRDRAETEGGN